MCCLVRAVCEKSTLRASSSNETDVKAFHIGILSYRCLQWVAESPGDLFQITFVTYVIYLRGVCFTRVRIYAVLRSAVSPKVRLKWQPVGVSVV
jgi:hypothetical protein